MERLRSGSSLDANHVVIGQSNIDAAAVFSKSAFRRRIQLLEQHFVGLGMIVTS